MYKRELDSLEAENLVAMIRKEAKLTPKESRYLTRKLETSEYDFNNLPTALMAKLREACGNLNITYNGELFKRGGE